MVYSASFHPGGIKDGEKKMKNKVKNEPRSTVRGVSKGYYVRRTRTRRKYRHRSRNPITNPPTKITNVPSLGKKICRNHTRVSRIQDEPGSVVCLRRTSEELLKQLESAGGFLKRYVAVNKSDAAKFEDLTTFQNEETNTPKKTKKLRFSRKSQATKFKSDLLHLRDGPTSSPTGTKIRQCEDRGTKVYDTNLHRLCTECSATTNLGKDKFPRYINEVICDDADHQCAANMGLCFQRTLHLSFLKFEGEFVEDKQLSIVAGKTVYKEVWESYAQELRSCCECEMYPWVYNRIASKDGGDSDAQSDEEDSEAGDEEEFETDDDDDDDSYMSKDV